MKPSRRPLIGVMGAGEEASWADQRLAEDLGAAIARRGWGLLSGGRPAGVMGAACAGAMAVEGHLVVGVLPDDGRRRFDTSGTAPLDVALFTGQGQARNVINVLSSDVVVVCGAGGAGTASEAAHALKAGRPLVLLAAPPDWQVFFRGLGEGVISCATVAEAVEAIAGLVGSAGGWPGPTSVAPGVGMAHRIDPAHGVSPTHGIRPAYGESPAHGVRPAYGKSPATGVNAAHGIRAPYGDDPARLVPPTRAVEGHQREQLLPVALVQLAAGDDHGANLRQAEAWLERALQPPGGRAKPRWLMLPEIWNAPYAAERFAAYAEPIPDLPSPSTGATPIGSGGEGGTGPDLTAGPSSSLAMVARLARRHGVGVIAGSIPERGVDGRLYNTATVIDPQGRLRAKHRKLHLFDVDVPGGIRFHESDSLSGGHDLAVLSGEGDPLETGLAQPPSLGLLICYDLRFPELALLLRQRHGATVVACPAAFNTTTGPRHWHLVTRARALDSQCFLLACSSARPLAADCYPSYGHSLVVDPWGAVIAEAGIGEEVLNVDLNLAEVSRARLAIPTGLQRRGDLSRLEQVGGQPGRSDGEE